MMKKVECTATAGPTLHHHNAAGNSMGNIKVHSNTPELVARASTCVEILQPFNGVPFSKDNLETQQRYFAFLVEYPSPLVLSDDYWSSNTCSQNVSDFKSQLEALQIETFSIMETSRAVCKRISALESMVFDQEIINSGILSWTHSNVGEMLFPSLEENTTKEMVDVSSVTEFAHFAQEGNAHYFNTRFGGKGDQSFDSHFLNFNLLLPDTFVGQPSSLHPLVESEEDEEDENLDNDVVVDSSKPPSTRIPLTNLQEIFGDEIFGKNIGEIWESTILNACISHSRVRNQKTEAIVLDSSKRLNFDQVLVQLENCMHSGNSEEILGLLEFVLRLDGFKPKTPDSDEEIEDEEEEEEGEYDEYDEEEYSIPTQPLLEEELLPEPPGLDCSNLFFFNIPVSREKLITSLISGRNTLLPLMLDSEKFVKDLNIEFMESTKRGLTLYEMNQMKSGLFIEDPCCNQHHQSQSSSDIIRRQWFLERCDEGLFGLSDVLQTWSQVQQQSAATSFAATGHIDSSKTAASFGNFTANKLKTLEANNWLPKLAVNQSIIRGEENHKEEHFKYEDWFEAVNLHGNQSCILAVRKDLWLAWVSTWTVHRCNTVLPCYEILLKHWRISSSGFKLVDKIRKYNVIRKLLGWLVKTPEAQTLRFVLSPDHVDFNEVYENLFNYLDMWHDSTVIMEDALNQAYQDRQSPSILKALVAMLLVKKHHVVDHDILHEIYDYIHGLGIHVRGEGVTSEILVARRLQVEQKHPFLLSVIETLRNKNTTSDLEAKFANITNLPTDTTQLIGVVLGKNNQSGGGQKRSRAYRDNERQEVTEAAIAIAQTTAKGKSMQLPNHVKIKEKIVPGRYISTSVYGWDLMQNHRGYKAQLESKRRKIGYVNSGGFEISALYNKVVKNGEDGFQAIYASAQSLRKQKAISEDYAMKGSSTPWGHYDYHTDPTVLYIRPYYQPLEGGKDLNFNSAYYVENGDDNYNGANSGGINKAWCKKNALEKILTACPTLTDEEKKYMHLWTDNGCVSELKYDFGVQPWNRNLDEENGKLLSLFVATTRGKVGGRRSYVGTKKTDKNFLQSLAQAKRTKIWERTYLVPIEEEALKESLMGTHIQSSMPKWMVLGEYMATKTLYKICSCELFPLEMRKKLFLSMGVVDSRESVKKRRDNRDGFQVLVDGTTNRTIHLGILDPKGDYTCDRYQPAEFKPTSAHNSYHYGGKYGKKVRIAIDGHRSKFKKYLDDVSRAGARHRSLFCKKVMSHYHDGINLGANNPAYVTTYYKSPFGASAATITATATQQEIHRKVEIKTAKEEWLWQDPVLFGGNDRKRALVDYLSREELNSTIGETIRLTLGLSEHAFQANYSTAVKKGEKFVFKRSYDALLPYKPCYRGFKKNLFDQARFQEQLQRIKQQKQQLAQQRRLQIQQRRQQQRQLQQVQTFPLPLPRAQQIPQVYHQQQKPPTLAAGAMSKFQLNPPRTTTLGAGNVSTWKCHPPPSHPLVPPQNSGRIGGTQPHHISHFKVNLNGTSPSTSPTDRNYGNSNMLFKSMATNQGISPNIHFHEQQSQLARSNALAREVLWVPRGDTVNVRSELKRKKNPSYDDATFILFHTDFSDTRLKILRNVVNKKRIALRSKKEAQSNAMDVERKEDVVHYDSLFSSTLYRLEAYCMMNFLPSTFICSSRVGKRITKTSASNVAWAPQSMDMTSEEEEINLKGTSPNPTTSGGHPVQQKRQQHRSYDEDKLRRFLVTLTEDRTKYRLYDIEVDSPEQETKWLEDEDLLLISRYHF